MNPSTSNTQFGEFRKRVCTVCGQRIPVERLRTLPDTYTCAKHSEVSKVTGAGDAAVDVEEAVDSAEGGAWDRGSHT